MGVNFDLNRALEHPSSRHFTFTVVGSFAFCLILVLLVLAFNGKHNKLPGGVETSIPDERMNTTPKTAQSVLYDTIFIRDTSKLPQTIINNKGKNINSGTMYGGHIGDETKNIYINSSPKLTQGQLENMIPWAVQLALHDSMTIKTVEIDLANTNAPLIVKQLDSVFRANGYKVTCCGNISADHVIQKIEFKTYKADSTLQLMVGSF